jgi:hypothetical protein
MGVLPLLIAAAVAAIMLRPPVPPDLSECRLDHAFVLGDFPNPAAIEIWECPKSSVITLTELGPIAERRERKFRSHFMAEVAPNEKIVGCKDIFWLYSGVVAVTSELGQAQPLLSRAWRADLKKWSFDEATAGEVVCNRDFGLR